RERGMGGDEPGVPAHELHEPDAVPGAARLLVRGCEHRPRGIHGGLEAEAPPGPLEVVVDRLRHPDDGDRKPALREPAGERGPAAETAVTPDDEQDLHVETDERIDHPIEVLRPARRAERRAPALVQVLDRLRDEEPRLVYVRVGEPRVAVAESVD